MNRSFILLLLTFYSVPRKRFLAHLSPVSSGGCTYQRSLIVQYYDNKFLHIHRRMTREGNIIAGVCRPFMHKVYVDCDGNLHLCENFTYGDSFGKFDGFIPHAPLQKLLNEYKSIRESTCKHCWASKMCSLCFRDVYDRSGRFNEQNSVKVCHSERKGLLEALTEYCTIMEIDSELLDHLDNYIIHV